MKIPIENRSSTKRVEIPVNITEEVEDKEYTEEYTRSFELDTKTKIIIWLIVIILIVLLSNRPSWVNRIYHNIQTNKIQMQQTAQTLSWLMVRQKELEKQLSEDFNLSINK